MVKESVKNSKIYIIVLYSVIFMSLSFLFFCKKDYSYIFVFMSLLSWIFSCHLFSLHLNLNLLILLICFEKNFTLENGFTINQLFLFFFIFIYVERFIIEYVLLDNYCKQKFISDNKNILLWTIICVIYSFYNFDILGITSLLGSLSTLALVFILSVTLKNYYRYKYIMMFINALIFSCCISIILEFWCNGWFSCFINNRFTAMCNNANTLQFLCLIGISFVIVLYCNKKINFLYSLSYNILLTAFGILTRSKAFLILGPLLIIIYMLACLKNKINKKNVFIVVLICSTFLIIFGIFINSYFKIFERFLISDYDNILDKITTGRASLWKKYLLSWGVNFQSILLGKGWSVVQEFKSGYHSSYVELLYKNGILGLTFLISLLNAYIKKFKGRIDFSNFNFLPLIIFLIVGCEECVFSFRIMLVVSILLLVKNNYTSFEITTISYKPDTNYYH